MPKGTPNPQLYVCACGGRKSYGTICCRTCEDLRRHADGHEQRVERLCQWCGKPFRRKGRLTRPGAEVFRFCRKKCWGAFRSTVARAERDARRQARRISRELTRAQRLFARSVCACGATITRPSGRMCNACSALRKREGKQRGQSLSRSTGLEHICPNCGESFRGYERDVFCSPRCGRQLKHPGRYPSIGGLSIDKRNEIAELIALVRSARIRLARTEGGQRGV